jgi:hypothetical protein
LRYDYALRVSELLDPLYQNGTLNLSKRPIVSESTSQKMEREFDNNVGDVGQYNNASFRTLSRCDKDNNTAAG